MGIQPTLSNILFHVLPLPVFILKAGAFLRVNQAFAELFGGQPSDIEGSHATALNKFVAPEDREMVLQHFARRLAGEASPEQYEFCFLDREGRRKPVVMDVRMTEWEGEQVVVGVIKDVSDKRRLEQQMSKIARGAPIVLSVFDREGVFEMHIGRGLKKLGLQENQLVGTSVYDAFKGADEALAMIRRSLAGEENRNIQDLGGTIWDNWFSPVHDVSGEIVGAVAISTDVTQRESTRKELERRIEIIESQAQAIRSMTAPIIQVWDNILVVPVVGELDRERASDMMERLLAELAARQARFVILELTGVEAVDSNTAAMLVRMLSAAELLGVKGLLAGIRPDVAQTLVTVGVDLSRVTTVATLHDGLRQCMGKS